MVLSVDKRVVVDAFAVVIRTDVAFHATEFYRALVISSPLILVTVIIPSL